MPLERMGTAECLPDVALLKRCEQAGQTVVLRKADEETQIERETAARAGETELRVDMR